MTSEDKLIARLADRLGQVEAADLSDPLIRNGNASAVLDLLDELHEASVKAEKAAIEALPELHRRVGLEAIASWLDLGVALAGSSGATALRYFKESPLILGLFESASAREPALRLALELADNDVNVALEFVKTAPALLAVLPPDRLPLWAEAGLDLARLDHVLGLEFFRQGPTIAAVVPLDQVRSWIGFGMKLITLNSLGKTDYLGTLEFFRTSPAILGDIEGVPVRKNAIELGSTLADRDPKAAILFLAESPAILRAMPSEGRRIKTLRYGMLIAERDAETALAYLRRCPEVLALIGNAATAVDKFENWFKGGMEVLEYSPEGARAYFALETNKALASLEQAMSGAPLRQIARTLKLFAQGLCGTDVAIRSLPDPPEPDQAAEALKKPARAKVSQDGRTISLPALLRRYPTREENIRLYRMMTAHEAGHLEFGTYDLSLAGLVDLIAVVHARYGSALGREARGARREVRTLAQMFDIYPQPGLIRDLWTVLEDARVEYRLQEEYPGLKQDLARLAREVVTTRSFLQGLSVRELVVDALLLLSTAEPGTVQIPDSIRDLVERAWVLSQVILTSPATAEDVVRVADRIYVLLEESPASVKRDDMDQGEPTSDVDQGAGPNASEETSGDYRPVTNWAYRGAMDPDLVRDRRGDDEQNEGDAAQHPLHREEQRVPGHGDGASSESPRPRVPASGMSDASRLAGERLGKETGEGGGFAPGTMPGSIVEQMLAVGDPPLTPHPSPLTSKERAFLYDEWDGFIQDYRSGWCRVIERLAPEGTSDFAEATLASHGPAVRLLRRYFESLRPPGLRLVRGQMDGEDVDLDAAIGRMADLAAGVEVSDRIFVRREKREREVAAAFLVDLSGSTSRRLDSQGQEQRDRPHRVIDVEKEGLILLGEALSAIGDQFAVYGYSGQGRRQVDFVILKDFDEPAGRRLGQRIGSIAPLHQNRDGAAIRHATKKLLARSARNRLLVLISDGKPLDDGYADEYSLEDTKMALREARMKGIDPFCITVDRHADEYLRRMYGDVRFLVIDRIGALPELLPRVYHRLTA